MRSYFLEQRKRNLTFALLLISWTILIVFLYLRNVESIENQIYDLALDAARNNFQKDVSYRDWAAKEGGVYVPITEITKPNPYLDIPNRDVETTAGQKLTLVNPAYMTRMVHEMESMKYGVTGHITSLNPISPINKPDEWEVKALNSFNLGKMEYHSIEKIKGKDYLKYMSAFVTTEPCLKCHGDQGYKVGDIRGGISFNVPFERYETISEGHKRDELIFHLITWMIGMGIMIGYFRLSTKNKREIEIKENELINKNVELEKKAIELSESEASLIQSQKVSHVGNWTWDLSTNQVIWSDEMKRILGIDPEKFNGDLSKIIEESIHPDDKAKVETANKEIIKSGRLSSLEYRVIHKDKSVHIIHAFPGELHYDDSNKIEKISGVVQDITERKKLERVLIEKNRLSAVGEMASAVAHDFNNSLQTIRSNADLALHNLDNIDKLKSYLNIISSTSESSAERIKLMQRIRGKRQKSSEFVSLDIGRMLDEVIEEAKPLWKDNAERMGCVFEIERNYKAKSNVLGNMGELKSVFFNLVKNGIEAMPDGGTLRIETHDNGEQVLITFKDTGIGMSDETKLRVFQPFFSSKGFEGGRGLGLSGAFGIIKEHKGIIKVENTSVGKGSEFTILLPAVNKTVADQKEENSVLNLEKLNILWVDDDESIRNAAEEMIEILGHNGKLVGSGQDALEEIEKRKYDLVITDIGMPKMNGWELIKKIRERKTECKIAILTGWGDQIEQEISAELKIDYVIAKPISMDEFEKIILKLQKNTDSDG